MTRIYAGTAVLLIAALLGGLLFFVTVGKERDPYSTCRQGQIATGAGSVGGPFTLVNEAGISVTDKDVISKPSLIYFGYTFCPDVCPIDNARNAEATDILEKRGLDVQSVFISVDPKRDTPSVLRAFTQNLSPKMIGLTGSEDQVKAAAKEYHVYYHIQDPTQKYYLFDHSTYTYLMMPGKGFLDFFRRDVSPQQMADRVACFMGAR